VNARFSSSRSCCFATSAFCDDSFA
jgi:hypothetical protein